MSAIRGVDYRRVVIGLAMHFRYVLSPCAYCRKLHVMVRINLDALPNAFHQAREVSPFADQADSTGRDHMLLEIALMHGITEMSQLKPSDSLLPGNVAGDTVLEAMRNAANQIEQSGGEVSFAQLLNLYLPPDPTAAPPPNLEPGVHIVKTKKW